MRRERRSKLLAALRDHGLDGLVLLGPSNQEYVGVSRPCADAMRMHHETVVVIVSASGDAPFVWTAVPEGIASDIPASNQFSALTVEYEEGLPAFSAAIREALPGAHRVGFDEMTGPMMSSLPKLLRGIELCNGMPALMRARQTKTADEIASIQRAENLNEVAMEDVYAAFRPGVRQNELSAIFLRRVFELGADVNIIDPIWSLTPLSMTEATFSVNGGVGFPLTSNDRFMREGDLILSDSGIACGGYHSDFGKTWICSNDPRPTLEQRKCFDVWWKLMDRVYSSIRPGATCGDLVRAASAVEKNHAFPHLYLGHGLGVDAAEAPFIGSDLGLAFDDTVELVAGMTFVLEPVIWREGVGAFRSEEVVAVTSDGFERLSTYGYSPFQ
jgi:Xaa-Pro aminopeptidase